MSAVLDRVVTKKSLVTADEMLLMPQDGFRYSLIKGELKRMPGPGGKHGVVTMRFGGALFGYVEEHDLGEVFAAETGFKLESDPDTVLGADVAFVSHERIPPGEFSEKYWAVVPDLTVEVVSPGNTRREIQEKVELYLVHGVRAVLIVYPKQRVLVVHRAGAEPVTLGENETLELPDIVPGFSYRVGQMFARQRIQ
jgi:Uma2 family endonuclease